MTTSPIPDSIHSLLSAAAIGALETDEQRVVDQYVEAHPDAQAELTALRTAASRLDSPDGPRPEVWARIVDEIDQDRRAPVVFIDRHRRRTRPLGRIAAVAAAVVVLAGTAAALTLDRNDGSLVNAPPSAQLRQSAAQALGAAGAQRASVVAEDGTTAHVVVLPSGVGYVLDIVRDEASRPTPLHVLYAETPTGLVEVARLDEAEPIVFQLPADTQALAIARFEVHHTPGHRSTRSDRDIGRRRSVERKSRDWSRPSIIAIAAIESGDAPTHQPADHGAIDLAAPA